MRKYIIFILAFVLLFLTACSGSKNGDSSSKSTSKSTSSKASSEIPEDEEDSNESEDENEDEYEDEENENEETDEEMTDETYATLSANISVKQKRADDGEIRPVGNTASVSTPLKGSSDAEAEILRKSILNAKDSLKITGTTYYVSSAGNDENDGTSPNAPLQSIDGVAALYLKAGDGVLFERGSIFRTGSSLQLQSGVSYGAYGSGEKPVVYGSAKNYAVPSEWEPDSKLNVWKISVTTTDIGIVVLNHTHAGIKKLDDKRNLGANNDFYHDVTEGMLYFYSDKGNPGKIFDDIEFGSKFHIFSMATKSKNITIDNISVKYGGAHGITGSQCEYITITNCEIGWIGGSIQVPADNTRYGNGVEFWDGCSNILIENCWVYQVYDAGLTFQGEAELPYVNITFKNNLIEYCIYAIEWWSRNMDSVIDKVYFTNNLMRFSGYGWGKQRRDTGVDCHIYGSSNKNYNKLGTLVVSNNVFDLAYSRVIYWAWNVTGSQPSWTLTNNTYYQSSTRLGYMFGIGTGWRMANNKTEFEAAVKGSDANPKLIKWID